ncbi:MAG: 4-(cytidine 5'-diphospho)-2-C-methyl-D-erythritol kinase [Clostridia bacterium]|nr:4-(cytidine 5'-diphospho)-2-C-methyl-D-erythritol kinase [Clostridia bacterium]
MPTYHSHAKINWALHILGRCENGYHNMDMLMQSIELCDELTIEPAEALSLTVDGAPADPRDLVLRAATALRDYTGCTKGARMTLKKHIPARAGLGGGSADCACTLRVLNEMWSLGLSDETLLAIGEKLGADLPFCLTGGLRHVYGIGEKLGPAEEAPAFWLTMVTPGGGLSTADVFRAYDAAPDYAPALNVRDMVNAVQSGDWDSLHGASLNSLEATAVRLMPEIETVSRRFAELGARFVRMSGSGSTVFAVFDTENAARTAASEVDGAIVTRTCDRPYREYR